MGNVNVSWWLNIWHIGAREKNMVAKHEIVKYVVHSPIKANKEVKVNQKNKQAQKIIVVAKNTKKGQLNWEKKNKWWRSGEEQTINHKENKWNVGRVEEYIVAKEQKNYSTTHGV